MQKKIPPYNWIVANGLTRSSIDFVCACYEYSKTHAKWSHLDVQAHLTKRAVDVANAVPDGLALHNVLNNKVSDAA